MSFTELPLPASWRPRAPHEAGTQGLGILVPPIRAWGGGRGILQDKGIT